MENTSNETTNTNASNSNKKSIQKKWWFWLIVIVILGQVFKSNNKTTQSSSSNSDSQSEEVSKRAYRAGYADGQLEYGEPNPPSYVFFLANHSEISGADKLVYKMGYDDAAQGKPQEY